MDVKSITPGIMCKNEENWIHFCLRDLLKVFDKVILLDTGSTDRTIEYALETAKQTEGKLQLIQHNYGSDAVKIGNGRNVLRETCETEWLFLVDSDELWQEDKLKRMLEFEIEPGVDVVMVAGWNVEDIDGKLKLRTHDLANRDGLFSRNIKWSSLHYPFEGYRLVEDYIEKGKAQYLPATEVFAWHMRHTIRSSKNWDTYFRKDKLGFYLYGGIPSQTYEDLPDGWIGEIDCRFFNPYLC